MKEKESMNISTSTLLRFFLIILLLALLFLIRDVLGMVFAAWVFSSAFDPAVDRLQRWKVPRFLGILFIYIAFFLLLSLIIYLVIPPLTIEVKNLTASFPALYEKVTGFLSSRGTLDESGFTENIQKGLDSISSSLTRLTGGVFSALSSIAGGVVWFVGIFVMTFYMTIEEDALKRFLQSIAPLKYQPYLLQKLHNIQSKLGSWLWGQFILMVVIGTLTFIGLTVLGVKYALVLALIAGFLEFIPYIGPIVAAIPALFFAASGGVVQVVLVLILYTVIQQLENHIIVPNVMKKAVGINPLLIIISLLVGAKIAGVIGMVLAIPAVIIISIFLDDIFEEKKKEENKLEQ